MTTPSLALLLACAFTAAAPPPSSAPLTLEEAVSLAESGNEAPGIARARIEQARAAREEAIGNFLPKLALTGTYTRRRQEVVREVGGTTATIQALNALNGSVTLGATLFDATAIPLWARANHLVEAAELSGDELRRQLALDVAVSFVTVLSAEQLVAATAHRIDVAKQAVGEARARLGAGLGAKNEVTRAELELATAELAQTQAKNAVVTARYSLGFLIAGDADRPLVDPPERPKENDDPQALTQKATDARKDVKALEAAAMAQKDFAREPLYRLFPTVGLLGTYRGTNEAGITGQATDWNVAVTLSWILFDGGIRYAQRKGREAAYAEQSLNLDATKRRVGLDIRTALANLDTSEQALKQAEVRLNVAKENLAEIQERFAHGLASALEQADASASEFEAQADLTRQKYAVRLSQLSLVRAMGQWPTEKR